MVTPSQNTTSKDHEPGHLHAHGHHEGLLTQLHADHAGAPPVFQFEHRAELEVFEFCDPVADLVGGVTVASGQLICNPIADAIDRQGQ